MAPLRHRGADGRRGFARHRQRVRGEVPVAVRESLPERGHQVAGVGCDAEPGGGQDAPDSLHGGGAVFPVGVAHVADQLFGDERRDVGAGEAVARDLGGGRSGATRANHARHLLGHLKRVARELCLQRLLLRLLELAEEIQQSGSDAGVHRAQQLRGGGFARRVREAERRLAPVDDLRDAAGVHAEVAHRASAEDQRLGGDFGVLVAVRAAAQLREDERRAERLGDARQGGDARASELDVREFLRDRRDHARAVARGERGSLRGERRERVERFAQHLEVLIVEAGRRGEGAHGVLRRRVARRRRHRLDRLRDGRHARQTFLPGAGRELPRDLGAVHGG